MTAKQMKQRPTLHDGWLQLEAQMIRRHGDDVWQMLQQGMKAAYYMGALAALNCHGSPEGAWKQAESGLQEAMGIPDMRIAKY